MEGITFMHEGFIFGWKTLHLCRKVSSSGGRHYIYAGKFHLRVEGITFMQEGFAFEWKA